MTTRASALTSAGLYPSGVRDNGGLTETIALLPTSPAIDAVPLGLCTDPAGDAVFDQRGVSRPQSEGCDIGAFEVVFIPTALELAPLSGPSFTRGWQGPLTLYATLQRTDLPAAVAGAEVAFLLDGVRIATVTTDVTGTASISYDPSSLTAGGHSVQAIAARQLSGDDVLERAGSAVQTLQVTPSPYAAQVLQPIRADGSSVFNLNRGVVPVKFALTYNGAATCMLPAATVRVTRLYGTPSGPVNEDDYVHRGLSYSIGVAENGGRKVLSRPSPNPICLNGSEAPAIRCRLRATHDRRNRRHNCT